MNHDTYCVFDLETTGLSPKTAVISEIGWQVITDGIPGPVRSLLVNCGQPVPEEVVTLTGITTQMLEEGGVPLLDALSTFLRDVAGFPLVGHNICRFDALFLEAACRSVGLTPPDRGRYIDTAALYKARRLALKPGNASHWTFAQAVFNFRAPGLRYNLAACCDALGIPRELTAHRAAADVEATQKLYAALCRAEPVEVAPSTTR